MPTPFERTWPVTALGRFSAPTSDMSALRGKVQSELIAAGHSVNLRHADEQGVACLAAMQTAIAASRSDAASFREWGVVAAPRTPGRIGMKATLLKFPTDGAWGVSPHIIPNCSLHSPSGLVSVTYGLRGPNFGVGGISGRESDLWTALIAFDATAEVPGAWLLMSAICNDDTCRAIALAVRFQQVPSEHQIAVRFGQSYGDALTPKFSLESLDRVLSMPNSPRSYCRWSLGGGGAMEWRWQSAALRAAA